LVSSRIVNSSTPKNDTDELMEIDRALSGGIVLNNEIPRVNLGKLELENVSPWKRKDPSVIGYNVGNGKNNHLKNEIKEIDEVEGTDLLLIEKLKISQSNPTPPWKEIDPTKVVRRRNSHSGAM